MNSPRTALHFLLLTMLSTALIAPVAQAQELLPPRVTDRKFPEFLFCPIPLEMSFVANKATATLRFSTTTVNYLYSDFQGTQQRWAHQSIDNICVVPENVYLANRGPLAGSAADCYLNAPVAETFYFHTAGTIPLKEDFSVLPSATGWDLSHGAYWYETRTAPNNPATGSGEIPLGSLGLGPDTPSHALTDSAFTTRQVSGLTPGTTYRVTGWWAVESMQEDKIFLTVAVLDDSATPIARTTWGALKSRFK